MKRKVIVIFTGGTISSKRDEAFGGIVPMMEASEILQSVPDIDTIAEIETIQFGKYPGPHITIELMYHLRALIQELVERRDVHGVVVTHGTDTLEETAYFMDCSVVTHKPIVFVGSMRNSSDPDWDGPRNLRDAIQVAATRETQGLGVLVVLAGNINAASEVSKTDTSELNTFSSLNFGLISRINNGEILLYRNPIRRESFEMTRLPEFVPLFKIYSGMSEDILLYSLDKGAEGLVIEAFGVGNVSPRVLIGIKEAIRREVPVVLVSRCPVGRIEHIYAYEGAGKQLYDEGVIFADFLNGQKARIKLIVALGANKNYTELKRSFEWANIKNTLRK